MSQEIEESIGQIRALCERSLAVGDFSYDHNDELGELCKVLSENPHYETWAPQLFELLEKFDGDVDLTLGSPGPLVHRLEGGAREAYRDFLSESLARKPTGATAWMAKRMSRSPDEDEGFWNQKIKNILNHPEATLSAKEIANDP